MNGLLITRGRIPPLIVTLGSFSLFRGLAEGITGGVDNFTQFPEIVSVSRARAICWAGSPRRCRSSSWSPWRSGCCCIG